MSLEQILQQEIKDAQVWLNREKDESVYNEISKKGSN
jgi:hypothetical protein